MKKKGLKEAIELIRENVKIMDKYWNEKQKWSRKELLEFIRNEVSLDDLV